MAIIEIQFKQNVFLNILGAKIIRQDFPRSLFSQLATDRLIERIEMLQVAFASDEDLQGISIEEGQLLAKFSFLLHHTSFVEARTAGSLQAPPTQTLNCELWLKLAPAAPNLQWFISRFEVENQMVPILKVGSIPVGDTGFVVKDMKLFNANGIVSVSLSTLDTDVLNANVVDKLEAFEWGFFVDGQVFADQLADSMNAAVKSSIVDEPDLEITSFAAGQWWVNPPRAHTSISLNAIDAGPLDIDVPIKISAESTFIPNLATKALAIKTTISWHATGAISALPGVQGKVNDAIKEKLVAPEGMLEVDKGESYISFLGHSRLFLPHSELFRTDLTNVTVENNGLHARGTVKVYPPPTADFYLEEAHWAKKLDCSVKNYTINFKPPVLHVFTTDSYFKIQVRPTITTDPPGFWAPNVVSANSSIGPDAVDIRFDLNPGMNPLVGYSTSAYFETNLGVRWVDLKTVPDKPTLSFVGLKAQAISECMAISDRWGMGIMNLDWLVDPPYVDYGLPAVREWTIIGAGIENAERIVFRAVGPGGERVLNMHGSGRGDAFLQLITDRDETLVVESRSNLSFAPPQVFQRWIIPQVSIPVSRGATPVALLDDTLFVKNARAVVPVSLTQATGYMEESATEGKELDDGRENTVVPTISGNRNVAVLHRGNILVGLASPFH